MRKGGNSVTDIAIVSAVRTPVGTFGKTLSTVPAVDLGALVIKEALNRAGIKPEQVGEVVMGNVLQAGLGQNPARQAAIKAGLPHEVPAWTLNKVCGSGLKTIASAFQAVANDDADIVVAGGMENMSLAPYLLPDARTGHRMGDKMALDTMIKDGLWCAFNDIHMGITAENLAEKYNITREEQDEMAVSSQQKAGKAIDNGVFKDEIVPVEIPQRKKDPIIFSQDEHPKPGTSVEKLGQLRPAFKKDGTVTAGNASGLNDGAAAVVVMKAEKAKELGIKPLAIIKSYSSTGVDPKIMGIGPVSATKKALQKAGLTIDQVDLFEANEAFAAQALAVVKELGLPLEKVNVNGGAIAIGHPIGASGARVLVTLIHQMLRDNAKYGLATLCIGGGQGVAMALENPNK